MVAVIDDTGVVIAFGTEGEIDNLDLTDEFQRTDDGVERILQVLDVTGDLIDEYDNIKDAVREYRANDEALKIVAIG